MSVAIIGGGLIGLACAAELAAAGQTVRVFDAAAEAREASWAAAGMLAPYHECTADSALLPLVLAGYDAYPQFLADHAITAHEVDYRVDGSWIPQLDVQDGEEIAHKIAFLHGLGVPHRLYSNAELAQLEPHFSPHIHQALSLPGGQINPRLLCQRLRERCARLNVTLHYRCPVTGIDDRGVRCDDTHYPADTVVFASGAWTPALAACAQLTLRGEPVKGQLLRFAIPDGVLNRFVLCRHAYLVPRAGDGLVVGATMVHSGFDKQEDEHAIRELAANARRLLPSLENAQIVETWTGLRPRLHSGLPCIAQVRPGVIIATGHYRNGILLAPITAQCVRALALDEKPPVHLGAFGLPE